MNNKTEPSDLWAGSQEGGVPADLWAGSQGGVPTVSLDDLKAVWQVSAEFEARNPGQCGAIGSTAYENVCSPGADVMSVWYRASMLWVLRQVIPDVVAFLDARWST